MNYVFGSFVKNLAKDSVTSQFINVSDQSTFNMKTGSLQQLGLPSGQGYPKPA